MVRQLGPGGAGDEECINPRAEAVAGEAAEKAFFGAFAVSDDDGSCEAFFQFRPE